MFASLILFLLAYIDVDNFQALEITIKDSGIMGIPFVLRSGESWIKNNDSDFYVSVEAEKKPKKVPKSSKILSRDRYCFMVSITKLCNRI